MIQRLVRVEYNDISINHADTLESDWPDGVVDGKDNPRMFDAVMANPPYSAHWNNKDREDDPRWREYGIAPKTKADYAFLLHCLYHLEDNGRMAIILPHGVLFRGAAEGRIRKALIDKHQIETVIGFPDKLFLNTSIPVVDTVVQREEIEKYSHLATLDEIKENDYNLNIPRYVDTYEEEPPVDLVALNNDIKNTNEEIKKVEAELLAMLDDLVVTEETQALIDATKEVFGG